MRGNLLIILSLVAAVKSSLIVETTSGPVKGAHINSDFFTTYLAFKGIPFAEPPVGDLRFRAPKPHKEWSKVRDATQYGSKCLSVGVMGLLSGGSEDCLYLNIYTNNVDEKAPVMVWLYGGAFVIGDGGPLLYGPQYLLKENIVVVTLNYRLAAFGFLSTADEHAQGNYALKDVLLALQWIKKNIYNFGGDDTKITLAGESAGAVITHHLSMSHKTEGLFHQAIMMSGNALLPFSFQNNPMKKTEALARNIGIKYNSTKDLMVQLRQVDSAKILKYTRSILDQDSPFGNQAFDFVISVEPKDSIDERLITDTPENLIFNGNYRTVPMIIGTTSKEGLLGIVKTFMDSTFLDSYNSHPEYYVPLSYNLNSSDTAEIVKVANTNRNIYFNNESVTDKTKDEFAIFQTDLTFLFPTDRVLKIYSQNPSLTIYNYKFSYDGSYNMVKLFMFLKGYGGACHGDDIFYLFKPGFPVLSWPWDHARTVQRRMLRLWGNFIKNGDPTPEKDDLIDIKWPKYTMNNQLFLDIGKDLSTPALKNLQVWHDFQKQFTNHL